jgi:hypothetical protein
VDAGESIERGANAGNLMRGGIERCPARWYRFEDEMKVTAGSQRFTLNPADTQPRGPEVEPGDG